MRRKEMHYTHHKSIDDYINELNNMRFSMTQVITIFEQLQSLEKKYMNTRSITRAGADEQTLANLQYALNQTELLNHTLQDLNEIQDAANKNTSGLARIKPKKNRLGKSSLTPTIMAAAKVSAAILQYKVNLMQKRLDDKKRVEQMLSDITDLISAYSMLIQQIETFVNNSSKRLTAIANIALTLESKLQEDLANVKQIAQETKIIFDFEEYKENVLERLKLGEDKSLKEIYKEKNDFATERDVIANDAHMTDYLKWKFQKNKNRLNKLLEEINNKERDSIKKINEQLSNDQWKTFLSALKKDEKAIQSLKGKISSDDLKWIRLAFNAEFDEVSIILIVQKINTLKKQFGGDVTRDKKQKALEALRKFLKSIKQKNFTKKIKALYLLCELDTVFRQGRVNPEEMREIATFIGENEFIELFTNYSISNKDGSIKDALGKNTVFKGVYDLGNAIDKKLGSNNEKTKSRIELLETARCKAATLVHYAYHKLCHFLNIKKKDLNKNDDALIIWAIAIGKASMTGVEKYYPEVLDFFENLLESKSDFLTASNKASERKVHELEKNFVIKDNLLLASVKIKPKEKPDKQPSENKAALSAVSKVTFFQDESEKKPSSSDVAVIAIADDSYEAPVYT